MVAADVKSNPLVPPPRLLERDLSSGDSDRSPISSKAMAHTFGSLLFRVSRVHRLTQHIAKRAVRLRNFTTLSCHNWIRLIAAQKIRIMRVDKPAVHSSRDIEPLTCTLSES
jgi:hypothetical protein